MNKRKNKPTVESDSDCDDNLDLEHKKKKCDQSPMFTESSSSNSSSSDSSSDSDTTDTNTPSKLQVSLPKEHNVETEFLISETKSELSDHEDGEVSSSDINSSYEDDWDESCVGDENDREYLNSLNQREREAEIYRRMQIRERLKTQHEIKMKLKARRQGNVNEVKKKAEPNNSIRRKSKPAKTSATERQLVIEEKKSDKYSLFQDFKESRQKKLELEAAREEKKKQNFEKEKLKVSDIYKSDNDSSEEGEATDDSGQKNTIAAVHGRYSSSELSSSSSDSDSDEKDHTQTRRDVVKYISCKEDLSKIRLSRHKMEKWCHMPFFKDTVIGCFVRIGIGNHKGQTVYRISEIVDVVETAKVYNLGNTRTNKGLRLKMAGSERVYRLEFISNQDFTDSEFDFWKKQMEEKFLGFPTIHHVEMKIKNIKHALNYQFQDKDIDSILKEKQRFKKTPHNYALKKTELLKERDIALDSNDKEQFEKINQDLVELENRASELDKQRNINIESVTQINKRNRNDNVKRAEDAFKAENVDRKNIKADPFTRQRGRPTLVTKSKDPEINALIRKRYMDQYQPISKEEIEAGCFTNKSNGNGNDQKNQLDENAMNLYDAHNFNVNINIDLPSVDLAVKPNTKIPSKSSGPKKSLNLEDYKRRQGLM